MKHIVKLGLFLTILLLVGCVKNPMKTEYYVGETARIDDLKVELVSANDTDAVSDKMVLEIVFKITNKRDNTLTINPDTYFRLYDLNQVQVPNSFQNNNNVIKKNQTIAYTLHYEVNNRELYEILFYSGIVENNIKFVIKGTDIN